MAHVAIVVLSWNGREDTLTCLDSLARVEWEPLSVLVVDNGSDDGTSEAVAERHPDVEIVRTETNLGFAEGNNVGIRRALERGADWVLLLNNDTTVAPDFLAKLVEEAGRRPDAGALSPLILYADPPDLIWYAGASFDPGKTHNGPHWRYRERDPGLERVYETGRVTGAAMLVSREVWEDVGLLAPELFLHVEDAEWSVRARRSGRRFYVVPTSRVWHRVSAATGAEESPLIAYYATRNTLEVGRRHGRLGTLGAVRHEAGTLATHLVHVRRAPKPLENIGSVIAGWRDFRRGRLGKRG